MKRTQPFAGRLGRTLAESQPDWSGPPEANADSPNVVMIMLDDLGYSDFGCFGGDIETPHIDRLAAQGLRYSRYTTVPMCTPARAAMLTGKNPHSVGCGWLAHNDPGYPGYGGEITLDAPTAAELLREAGYSTWCAGKWHNTYDGNLHAAGERSSWPIQRGFERFYGFLGAETSYFQPERMFEGNEPVHADHYPNGYYAPDDITTRSISWINEHQSSDPDKPFFLYLAYQSPHGPLQAKATDRERYRGRFSEGWDIHRARRFERQQALGLLEPNAVLAPRNPGVPAWDELTDAERRLCARYMEIYAAVVDNIDQNVGRVLAALERAGKLANTLIMITSDNGADSIGGHHGFANLQDKRQGFDEDPALTATLLAQDRLGDADTYPVYPTGWTTTSNTPFRMYKRTPMAGGIRVPMVMHWPQGIKDAGSIRSQWIHVTDITPTLLALAGGEYPQQFNGLRTRGFDGASFAASLRDASTPARRTRQYYELGGNRGYISGDWKIVSLQPPNETMNLDNWMLFNLASDPTETRNLAADQPEELARMIAEFEDEATRNYVYPIDNRDEKRNAAVPPYRLGDSDRAREFFPGAQSIPTNIVSPLICNRPFTLIASFDWKAGDEGVVFSLGDRFGGMVLYVRGGSLYYVYQVWHRPIELAPVSLTPGAQRFEMSFALAGQRKASATFSLNGRVTTRAIEIAPTLVRFPLGGLNLGLSRRQPVSARLEGLGAFAYTGTIDRIRVEPGPRPCAGGVRDERAYQAELRAAAGMSRG